MVRFMLGFLVGGFGLPLFMKAIQSSDWVESFALTTAGAAVFIFSLAFTE